MAALWQFLPSCSMNRPLKGRYQIITYEVNTMKMFYESPEMEMLALGVDVITASDGTESQNESQNPPENESGW